MPAPAKPRRRPRESDPCINGGDTHAWESLGLDTGTDGVLVSVRRCAWCRAEQDKPYGAGSRRSWRDREKQRSDPGKWCATCRRRGYASAACFAAGLS